MPETGARAPSDVLTSDASGHDTLEGLRATIDLAPIGMAQFDLQGRFLHVNTNRGRLTHSPSVEQRPFFGREVVRSIHVTPPAPSSPRSAVRARDNRDFTVPSSKPNASAISG